MFGFVFVVAGVWGMYICVCAYVCVPICGHKYLCMSVCECVFVIQDHN